MLETHVCCEVIGVTSKILTEKLVARAGSPGLRARSDFPLVRPGHNLQAGTGISPNQAMKEYRTNLRNVTFRPSLKL